VTESYAVDLGTLHAADVEDEHADDIVADKLAMERVQRVKAIRVRSMLLDAHWSQASTSVDKPPEDGAIEDGSNSQSLFKLSMESRRSSRPTGGLSQTKASSLTVIDSTVDEEQACQVRDHRRRHAHNAGVVVHVALDAHQRDDRRRSTRRPVQGHLQGHVEGARGEARAADEADDGRQLEHESLRPHREAQVVNMPRH